MIYFIAEFQFGNEIHEVKKSNILSTSSSIMTSGNIKEPYYGLISNGGSCSFIDNEPYVVNGEIVANHKILYFLENGFAYEKITTKIFLYNSLTKKKSKIGQYFAQDGDYDYSSNIVTFTLKDGLEEFQNIPVDDRKIQASNSLLGIYVAARATATMQTGFEFEEELDAHTRYELGRIKPYYSNDPNAKNFWAWFDNICKAGLCHMFINEKGKIQINRRA